MRKTMFWAIIAITSVLLFSGCGTSSTSQEGVVNQSFPVPESFERAASLSKSEHERLSTESLSKEGDDIIEAEEQQTQKNNEEESVALPEENPVDYQAIYMDYLLAHDMGTVDNAHVAGKRIDIDGDGIEEYLYRYFGDDEAFGIELLLSYDFTEGIVIELARYESPLMYRIPLHYSTSDKMVVFESKPKYGNYLETYRIESSRIVESHQLSSDILWISETELNDLFTIIDQSDGQYRARMFSYDREWIDEISFHEIIDPYNVYDKLLPGSSVETQSVASDNSSSNLSGYEREDAAMDSLVISAFDADVEGNLFSVPKLNWNSPGAASINESLWDKYYIERYVNDNNWAVTWLVTTDEGAATEEWMVSLLVSSSYYKFGGDVTYDVYNILLPEGRLLSKDEALQYYGISIEEWSSTVRSYAEDRFLQQYSGAGPQDLFDQQYQRTISDENIQEAVPWLDMEGIVRPVYYVYAMAGRDRYQYYN